MGDGDALHVGDLDPYRSEYEVFKVNEDKNETYGAAMYDPRSGNMLWA
ncbi:rhamnogalacturonan lyase family protein [Paenibacillus sp. NPDC055715]